MRIAISALAGMTVTLSALAALAQQPAPPPSGHDGGPDAAPPAPAPPPAAPPAPPPPGIVPAPEPPAPVASPFPPEGESGDDRADLVGWRGGFFIRDSRDNFRFYPHFLAETDFYSSLGPGVSPDPAKSSAPAPDVAAGLKPRLLLRRARIGFDAEILKRWSVTAILEFGGQPLGNLNGTTETSAAKPGATPTAQTGRYAPVQSIASAPFPADVFIGYSVCKCLNVQIGTFNVPFSMDNRTGDDYYPMLERPVAIRNFVVPTARDIGGILWGELGPKLFNYELGVFGGDGQNRPSVDARVDFMGRIFARPFATLGSGDLARYTQIGLSARHGDRDPTAVGYDMPAITTNQGFVLWKPTYTDSLGRQVHVIPSGAQNEIGGELRLQVWRFALQSEAYFVANNTREAVDGFQLTNTERFGQMKGVGWYAQLSAWPFGDAFLTPEPGIYRPRHLDLSAKPPAHTPHGLEVLALASGINGEYRGSTRLKSTPDPKTPMSDITVYQVGLGANYWHTKHARFGVYYMAYLTPDSTTPNNQAVVADNLTTNLATMKPNAGHVLHELSARLAVAF